jgi:hypothetical protein
MSASEIQGRRLPVANPRSRFWTFLLILVLLLGFALRMHNLEGQSMWSDEGLSLYRARLSLSNISQNIITVDGIDTRDTNPPFYFMLLHLWRNTTGETIFALRFLGVAMATLAVPLIYVLGKITFGHYAGFVASFLMAISPFHVWQTQVLRNYGMLLTLNLLSIYGLFRFILSEPGRRRIIWLVIWAGAALIGIYTHYFSFFIFAFGLLSLVLFALHQWGIRHLAQQRWLWAGLVLALLVTLPALFISINRFLAGTQIDFYFVPIHKVIYQAASAFSVGMDPSLVHPWWRVVPAVLLAILGIIIGWLTRRRATLLLLGYQLIPLGLLLGLSLINPLYNGTRHLLIGLPPFLLFVAEGVVSPLQKIRRPMTKHLDFVWSLFVIVLGILLVASQVDWLHVQFTSPRLVRDDVRGVAEYLNTYAGPNDLIVVHDTLIRFTFDYYYHGSAPVTSIPLYHQVDAKTAIDNLRSVVEPGKRIWFLKEPTPRNGIERQALTEWIRENWPEVFERSFPWMWLEVGLSAFVPEPEVANIPSTAASKEIIWPGVLRMEGYEIPAEATSGADLWLTFYLSQQQAEAKEHTLSFRFIDEKGQEWAQVDKVIKSGFPPLTDKPGELMRYDQQLLLPAGLPPGQYQVWLRLLDTASGRAIPLSNGEPDLHLSELAVDAASCGENSDQFRARFVSGSRLGQEIELQGYDWPEEEYRPGHLLPLKLWWCARQNPESDYLLQLRLIDQDGRTVADSEESLSRFDYPPTQWQPGQLIFGQSSIMIPAQAEKEQYELFLSLIEPDTEVELPVGWPLGRRSLPLGTVRVKPWSKETELPPISHPLRADFGQPPLVEFHGYETSTIEIAPGDSVDISLIWRSAVESIPASYTVFLHLVNEQEQILAQGDGLPMGGFRPTTSWRQDEVIVDDHTLQVPAELAPGTYNLWVGLFDPATNERLPIFIDGVQQLDDRLLLEMVQIGN